MNGKKCTEQGAETVVTMAWFPVLEKATKATTTNTSSPVFMVVALVTCEDSLVIHLFTVKARSSQTSIIKGDCVVCRSQCIADYYIFRIL